MAYQACSSMLKRSRFLIVMRVRARLQWLGTLAACGTMAIPLMGTEIIAHRGDSDGAPENTLASLKLGYERNADAGELDIHLAKDGGIVVLHDPDTYRTTGVSNRIAAS